MSIQTSGIQFEFKGEDSELLEHYAKEQGKSVNELSMEVMKALIHTKPGVYPAILAAIKNIHNPENLNMIRRLYAEDALNEPKAPANPFASSTAAAAPAPTKKGQTRWNLRKAGEKE